MKSIILLILSIVLLTGLVLSRRTYHHKDDDAFSSGTQKWRQQRMLKQRALCEDRCVARYHDPSQCNNICEELLSGKRREYKRHREGKKSINNRRGKRDNSLSDLNTYEEQQMEATRQLWELFHKNLRSVLNNGAYSPGFQLVQPNYGVSNIEEQILGWESMPISEIIKAKADDFDDPEVLGNAMIRVSKLGPIRDTTGSSILDEYKDFLAGVQGVSSIDLAQIQKLPSKALELKYQEELDKCTEAYESATVTIKSTLTFEVFRNVRCSPLKAIQTQLYAQIGKEKAAMNNNPAYDAAYMLGDAISWGVPSSFFKKYQSVRAIEYECLMARDENRPMKAQSKSLSFSYNFHNWKDTKESANYQGTHGLRIIQTTGNQDSHTATSLDLTAIGGVNIKFTDFRYIPIFAGPWYSSTAYEKFRYFPREPSASPISRFFSQSDGTLKLFPKGLYVATNPVITFSVASSKKDEFKQTLADVANSGMRIFGFGNIRNHSRHTSVYEGNTSSGKTEISISFNDCKPQLFAVDNYFNY